MKYPFTTPSAESQYSGHARKPKGCYVYTPDNYDDGRCFALWQPAPELGARIWTRNGQRILIGLYHDEGRDTVNDPVSFQYTIADGVMTIYAYEPHGLSVGDEAIWSYPPIPSLIVTEVVSDTIVKCATEGTGESAGQGDELIRGPVSVPENYVVYRLLPSFKPISIQLLHEILEGADPEEHRQTVSLTDIQTGDVRSVSEMIASTTGIDGRLHRQQLNELEKPLKQQYDAKGQVIPPEYRFSENDNAKLYLTKPRINQHDPIPSNDTVVHVYDYYGQPLNNGQRWPLLNVTDLIYYDADEPTGIGRLERNGEVLYSGPIYDVFGDPVVGIRANNTVITRKPVQPILMDHHNTPYKQPIRRG